MKPVSPMSPYPAQGLTDETARLERVHEAGEVSIYAAMHDMLHLYEKHNGCRPGVIRITRDQWFRLKADLNYARTIRDLREPPNFLGIPLDITGPIA